VTQNTQGFKLTERGAFDWKSIGLVLLTTPLLLLVGIWFYFGWPLTNAPFGGMVGIWCWGFGIAMLAFVIGRFRKNLWLNSIKAGLMTVFIIGLVWFAASSAAHQLSLTLPYLPMFGSEG
jgi:hypothetical protein